MPTDIQTQSGITSQQARSTVDNIRDRVSSINAARAMNIVQRQQGLESGRQAREELEAQDREQQSEFEKRLQRIQGGDFDLTPAEKEQLRRTQETYKRLARNQQFVNRNLETGQMGLERSLGTSRFSPELAAGNIGQVVTQGIDKIEEINTEREQAIADLNTSFMENRVDAIMEEYGMFTDATERRREAIKEQEEAVKEQADFYEDLVRRQESMMTTDQRNYAEAQRQGFSGTLMDFKRTYGKTPKVSSGSSSFGKAVARALFDPESPAFNVAREMNLSQQNLSEIVDVAEKVEELFGDMSAEAKQQYFFDQIRFEKGFSDEGLTLFDDQLEQLAQMFYPGEEQYAFAAQQEALRQSNIEKYRAAQARKSDSQKQQSQSMMNNMQQNFNTIRERDEKISQR